jgi:polyribonucleotide nucleotidyltransferase
MSTKKSKITVVKKKFNAVVDTTKNSVKKVNQFALNTTEEVVTETITIAEQWQKVSTKAIKEGFKLASNQQDIVFDALDTFNAQFKNGKKRFTKLFA